MRIILSRDRPAQLDLLLRSLERFAPPEQTCLVYRRSDPSFAAGYATLLEEHRDGLVWASPDHSDRTFEHLVRSALDSGDTYTTFLCDDDVLFRSNNLPWPALLDWHDDLLCFSLRLGSNTSVCYPTGITHEPPSSPWRWPCLSPDFGYPGSLDGHVFRTADLQRILAGKRFGNPTALECILQDGCVELFSESRPEMFSYPESVLVGVPVNRVSEQSNVRHGGSLIYSAENLNDSFLAGMRLDLDEIDSEAVNGAHTELELRWMLPVGARG